MSKPLQVPNTAVSRTLLLVLIVAIVPVGLVVSAGVSVPFTLAVAAAYALQISILLFMAFHWKIVPRDPWLGLAMLCGFAQLLTLASTTIQYGDFALMDLANAFSKVVGIVVYAGLISALVPTEGDLKRFLRGILVVASLAIIVNIFLNGSQFSEVLSVSSSYSLDFSSFFANRNQFGSFLFISIVAHCLYLDKRKLSWFSIVLFAAQLASLILTMSRGAILAFGVFWLVFALLQLRKRPKYLMFFILSGITVILVVIYLELDDVFNRVILRSESGLSGRDSLWSAGLEVWTHSSVFLGAGSFSGLEIAQERGMYLSEFHSFWVETLVSGGVIELCIILLIVGIAWRRLMRSSLNSYRRNLLYSAAIGFLVLSFVESISLFTIGLVGTMYSIFLVSVPLLYAGLYEERADGRRPAEELVESI